MILLRNHKSNGITDGKRTNKTLKYLFFTTNECDSQHKKKMIDIQRLFTPDAANKCQFITIVELSLNEKHTCLTFLKDLGCFCQ